MGIEDRVMTFAPNRRETLWGAEEWLVSAHPAAPSRLATGRAAGATLRDVAPDFPLLVKIIDARQRLSVQVHPNEDTRRITGGDAKTEMWCALNDGFIYAGLKPGVGAADVERAVGDGSFEALMVRHDVTAGDVLFIPGGLVHAIGEGTRVYEVQQSSDTTFRLYDWGRVGADGRPRELHVAKALEAIDYTLPPPQVVEAVDCPFFRFEKLRLAGSETLSGDGYTILYAAQGAIRLGEVILPEGTCALVAPGPAFTLSSSSATVFVTR